jgi:hypothetical protein
MIVPAGTITTDPHAAHIDTAMREGTHYDYAAQRWLDGQDHLHVTFGAIIADVRRCERTCPPASPTSPPRTAPGDPDQIPRVQPGRTARHGSG